MAEPKADPELATAIAHHQAGRLPEAMVIYDRIIQKNPADADALHLLGLAYHFQSRDELAIPLFQRAIAAAANAGPFYGNFGELWRKQGNWANAIDCYRKALSVTPDNPPIRQRLAESLDRAGRLDEALAEYRIGVRTGPSAEGYAGLCDVLRRKTLLQEAVSNGTKAVQLNPKLLSAQLNLALALLRSNRVRESLPHFDAAIAINPTNALCRWHRAWAYLTMGDFKTGWADYEYRWKDREIQEPWTIRQPLWMGQPVPGQTLLLRSEQGFGDTIQFIRYVPMLAERCGQLIVECAPELARLLIWAFPQAQFYHEPGAALPPFDCCVPIMSLPLAMGTTLETIPRTIPYLRAETNESMQWKQKLGDVTGLKVGIVWSGRPTHKNDANRSMKFDQFLPLARIPGIRWFNLQMGEAAGQTKEASARMTLIDYTSELSDFAATAALVENLDLVIAVDTAIVHLCGAMGKPAWVLLPFAGEYRWMLDRADSPWYPTLRLFRQPKLRDWETVIQRVGEELRKLIK